MGGVEGRDDERLLVCPAPPPDSEPEPCRYGPAGGPTYAEATERELAGLRSLVGGTDPLYGVTVDDAGCFHLELRRSDRSEERRVGNECVSTCRSRGSP